MPRSVAASLCFVASKRDAQLPFPTAILVRLNTPGNYSFDGRIFQSLVIAIRVVTRDPFIRLPNELAFVSPRLPRGHFGIRFF